jgi:uracil DNA glycosylase/ribonuclease HI
MSNSKSKKKSLKSDDDFIDRLLELNTAAPEDAVNKPHIQSSLEKHNNKIPDQNESLSQINNIIHQEQTLSPTEKAILVLLKKVHPTWKNILYSTEYNTKVLLDSIITTIISEDKDFEFIVPKMSSIFNFAQYPLNNVKVVILGQSPSLNPNDSHGYSYSSISSKRYTALNNIYKSLNESEMISDDCYNKSSINSLNNWSRQGVLLLNTALTTKVYMADYHTRLWSVYTNKLIELISANNNNIANNVNEKIIWLLWGKDAILKEQYIKNNEEHINHIIKTVNSPTSDKFVEESKSGWSYIKEVYPSLWWNPLGHIGYTDGACKNNQNSKKAKVKYPRAAYGYHLTEGPYAGHSKGDKVLFTTIEMDGIETNVAPTNIRAEGLAILRLLEFIKAKESHMTIIIHTDSQFWIDMVFKWMPTWVKRIESGNMKWTDKKNFDIAKDLWDIVQYFKDIKCPVVLKYVPAWHDCKPAYLKDITSSNYTNWAGNKRAEEVAEEALDE